MIETSGLDSGLLPSQSGGGGECSSNKLANLVNSMVSNVGVVRVNGAVQSGNTEDCFVERRRLRLTLLHVLADTVPKHRHGISDREEPMACSPRYPARHMAVLVGTRPGWPDIRILRLGELTRLICNVYLSVMAGKTVGADPSLRYTQHVAETLTNKTKRNIWLKLSRLISSVQD